MSINTAAPTIDVTAEEAETIRMDPYWMAMRVHNNDIEEFDDELELSTGEHIEWLEACQANIERWIRVLRQLESGVLAAEPWLIEEIRKEARRLDDFPEDSAYPAEPARAAEWREIYRLNAARVAALTALADRLEAALAGVPRCRHERSSPSSPETRDAAADQGRRAAVRERDPRDGCR